jgi:hypothetical protein
MTSRYAIVGRWYADPNQRHDQSRELHETIVPDLRGRAGFLAGYWTRDPESGRTHATILFADETAAREYKALLDANRQKAATLGVIDDYLIVADVLAEAYPRDFFD